MKILISKLGIPILSRHQMTLIKGGVNETATCTADCKNTFTITCSGQNCRAEDSNTATGHIGWCKSDTEEHTCALQ